MQFETPCNNAEQFWLELPRWFSFLWETVGKQQQNSSNTAGKQRAAAWERQETVWKQAEKQQKHRGKHQRNGRDTGERQQRNRQRNAQAETAGKHSPSRPPAKNAKVQPISGK